METAPLRVRLTDLTATQPFNTAQLPTRGRGQRSGVPHVRDFHEFVLCRAGVAEHRMTGRTIRVIAGDVTLLRPDDLHTFVALDDAGFDLVSVAFPTASWTSFCALAGVRAADWDAPEFPVVHAAAATRVPEVFDDLLHQAALSPQRVDLVSFLAEVTRRLSVSGKDHGSVPGWLTAACALMDSEDGLRDGVPGMVRAASVSHSHLTRTMSTHLTTTPAAYVHRRRMERAALLLATTDEPVGRVATRCGFSSQSYFARRFVEHFGIAPRAYRAHTRRTVT